MSNSENKDKNRKFYDEAFAEVFTNRQILESFLKEFLNEEWVKHIDFSTLKEEKTVFKGIKKSTRIIDLLLTFNIDDSIAPGGQSPRLLYIYIFMEFQSTRKPIIMRIFEYLYRIYSYQYKQNNILYPVIPIVIYNGDPGWTEKNSLRDHMAYCNDEIARYLPVFEYFLVDEIRLDDKLLEKLKGAAAAFFYLDKTDLEKREVAEKRIINLLKKFVHSNSELHKLLSGYVSGLLSFKGLEMEKVNDYIIIEVKI